jgi:(p)ppGpp synthase/HD superfamily hydrolase
MDITEKAKVFAIASHHNQMYGGVPYLKHLQDVVNVVESFGYSDNLSVCCAWLHDTLEDTNTSYHDIKQMFGIEIAEIVYLVTNEKGRNRAEKAAKTYPQIKGKFNATLIKLADRIANVGASKGTGYFDMYKEEQPKFREYLYAPIGLDAMWNHLESLFKE